MSGINVTKCGEATGMESIWYVKISDNEKVVVLQPKKV